MHTPTHAHRERERERDHHTHRRQLDEEPRSFTDQPTQAYRQTSEYTVPGNARGTSGDLSTPPSCDRRHSACLMYWQRAASPHVCQELTDEAEAEIQRDRGVVEVEDPRHDLRARSHVTVMSWLARSD